MDLSTKLSAFSFYNSWVARLDWALEEARGKGLARGLTRGLARGVNKRINKRVNKRVKTGLTP